MADVKILVVDDDIDINEFVCLYLESQNYHVLSAYTGKDALKIIIEEKPDIIILDTFLPDMDGIDLCREFRKLTLCPIIFIGTKADEYDIIHALEIGGDDFLRKPFSPKELIARIKSQLRRQSYIELNNSTEKDKHNILKLPNLSIDYDTYTIILSNRIIKLSIKEFELFTFFVNNPNKIFSMEELYDAVWSAKSFGDTRTVMVHVSNLRKKIEDDPSNPKYIINIRGMGYKFLLPTKA